MFPKSSVFAVVALAAFVSLGALLFPQVGQAQECIWDCDLGSDSNDFPGENSPGFSILYCFDQPCVTNLKDSNGNLIFTGDNIPTAHVEQVAVPNSCPSADVTISITGRVVAVLRDSKGIILPQSAAEAEFTLGVKGATCSSSSTLSRVVAVNEPRTDVFDATSSIKILKTPILNVGNSSLTATGWGEPGCSTNRDGTLATDCPFPFGIVEFNNINTLSNELPETGTLPTDFLVGEVYRGVGSLHFVGVRMCKGDANSTDPSTIACSHGGFVANAVWQFGGEWTSRFNPGSRNAQYDITTEHFASIDPQSVTATLVDNGGIPITPTISPATCFLRSSDSSLRCNFDARDFGLTQCPGPSVNVEVRGQFSLNDTLQKFKSEDSVTCSSK